MLAASRHGTRSLASLPKDVRVSYFGRSSGRPPIQFLTSAKLMELAGPLGHSPQMFSRQDTYWYGPIDLKVLSSRKT